MPPKYLSIPFWIMARDRGSWDDDPDVGDSLVRFFCYERDLSIQAKPNEIVIPMTTVRLSYTHPFKDEIICDTKSKSPEGMTRVELASQIISDYKRIYKDKQDTNLTGHPFHKLVLHGLHHRVNNIFDVHVNDIQPWESDDYDEKF